MNGRRPPPEVSNEANVAEKLGDMDKYERFREESDRLWKYARYGEVTP